MHKKSSQKSIMISKQGYIALKAEYDQLVKIERPKFVDVVAWAASNGDRSENADYHYGKKKLREIDRRLNYISSRLENFEIIDIDRREQGKVCFGSTVKLEYEDGKTKIVKILGEDEIYGGDKNSFSELKNRETLPKDITVISNRSPLAKAIMSKCVGDYATMAIRSPSVKTQGKKGALKSISRHPSDGIDDADEIEIKILSIA